MTLEEKSDLLLYEIFVKGKESFNSHIYHLGIVGMNIQWGLHNFTTQSERISVRKKNIHSKDISSKN